MAGIHPTLTHDTYPCAQLQHYPINPRRGNVNLIAESLRINGQYRPIVVNRRTTQVLAGNHTLAAAKQLGWTDIAVSWVDVDEDAAKRIVLADNRLSDLATNDPDTLAELLDSLPTLDGTGYTSADLSDLLGDILNREEAPERRTVESYTVTVEADSEDHAEHIAATLTAAGYRIKE